jgi:hypothetical protein
MSKQTKRHRHFVETIKETDQKVRCLMSLTVDCKRARIQKKTPKDMHVCKQPPPKKGQNRPEKEGVEKKPHTLFLTDCQKREKKEKAKLTARSFP